MITMDLSYLNNYATLIQLISAVNFAYIFTRFHQRVYRLIFNEKKLIDDKFTSFTNDMTVDMDSLETMDPLDTTNGQTNRGTLDKLKEDFRQLKTEWDSKKEKMTNLLQRVKQVKGVRSLFLYISLFCLIDLFNIANSSYKNGGIFDYFFIVFSLASIVVPAILTYKILTFKWESKSEVLCYKWTSTSFVFTTAGALILTLVFYNLWGLELPEWAYSACAIIAVFLPFYACLFSIFYVWGYEKRIKYLAGSDTKEVRETQEKLHQEKIKLDMFYRMFNSAPPTFE